MTDTAPATPAARVAALLARVREGWSVVAACRVLHVSQRTVWRWRRTKPEFAAALHEALTLGADIRKAERDDDIREEYSAHVLERAERYHREDAPSRKDETRKQRRLLAKLHGVNMSLFPGCSPSDTRESDDLLQRTAQRHIRARMADSFEERRRQKRLAGNTTPQATHMAPQQRQQLLRLLAKGSTIASACRKLGIDEADVLAERQADPSFTRALGEAMEQAAEARESNAKPEKPKKTGIGRVLF